MVPEVVLCLAWPFHSCSQGIDELMNGTLLSGATVLKLMGMSVDKNTSHAMISDKDISQFK